MGLPIASDHRLIADQARIGSDAFVGQAFCDAIQADHARRTFIGGKDDVSGAFSDYIQTLLSHGKAVYVAFAERITAVDWQRFVATAPPTFVNELLDAATNLTNATTGIDLKEGISALMKLLGSFWAYLKSFYSGDEEAQSDEKVVQKESSGFMSMVYARMGSFFNMYREQIVQYYHMVASGVKTILTAFREAYYSAVEIASRCVSELVGAITSVSDNLSKNYVVVKRAIVRGFFFVAAGCNEVAETAHMIGVQAKRYITGFAKGIAKHLNNILHYFKMYADRLMEYISPTLSSIGTATGQLLRWMAKQALSPTGTIAITTLMDTLKWVSIVNTTNAQALGAMVRGLMVYGADVVKNLVMPTVEHVSSEMLTPLNMHQALGKKTELAMGLASNRSLPLTAETRNNLKESADKITQFTDYVKGFREKTFAASLSAKASSMWGLAAQSADISTRAFFTDEDVTTLQPDIDALFARKYGMSAVEFQRRALDLEFVLDSDIATARREINPPDKDAVAAAMVGNYFTESKFAKYVTPYLHNTWTPEDKTKIENAMQSLVVNDPLVYPNNVSEMEELLASMEQALLTAELRNAMYEEKHVDHNDRVFGVRILSTKQDYAYFQNSVVMDNLREGIKFLRNTKLPQIQWKRYWTITGLAVICFAAIGVAVAIYYNRLNAAEESAAYAKLIQVADNTADLNQKMAIRDLLNLYKGEEALESKQVTYTGFRTYLEAYQSSRFSEFKFLEKADQPFDQLRMVLDDFDDMKGNLLPNDVKKWFSPSIMKMFIEASKVTRSNIAMTWSPSNNRVIFDALKTPFNDFMTSVRASVQTFINSESAMTFSKVLSIIFNWNPRGNLRNMNDLVTAATSVETAGSEKKSVAVVNTFNVIGKACTILAFIGIVISWTICSAIVDVLMGEKWKNAPTDGFNAGVKFLDFIGRIGLAIAPIVTELLYTAKTTSDLMSWTSYLASFAPLVAMLGALMGGPVTAVMWVVNKFRNTTPTATRAIYSDKTGEPIATLRVPLDGSTANKAMVADARLTPARPFSYAESRPQPTPQLAPQPTAQPAPLTDRAKAFAEKKAKMLARK